MCSVHARWLALAYVLLGTGRVFALDPTKALIAYGRQTWRTDSGLPQNTIHAILQNHEGYLWLATEGGLVRFDGLQFVVFDSQNTPQIRSNNIRALAEDPEGNLWIATADGLTRFNGSDFKSFTTQAGLPSNNVLALDKDQTGVIRITTSEGIVQNRGDRFQPAPSASTAPVNKAVLCQYKDSHATLWIGTDTGLSRVQNGRTDRFPPGDPLATESILSIFEDREGDLWIGTDSDGVTVLRNPKFTSYTVKDGLPSDLVRCVFEDRQARLWVGTDSGLARFESGRFSALGANGLSSNVILSLADDAYGNLLAGTPDGLNVVGNGGVKIVTSADGLPDDFVRSIYRDADDSLWIGTRRGLSHLQSGTFTTYTQRDGLGSDLVGAITRDRQGNLWVGTFRGLSRFSQGKFVTILDKQVITALWPDENGVLWIGTQSGGLNRFDHGALFHYPESTGLPDVIYSISEDRQQRLWLTSKTGLFRVGLDELNAMSPNRSVDISVARFTASDGLPVSESSDAGHPSAWQTRDGALWFAMSKGLASTQPSSFASNGVPLPVVIESVSVDDQALSPTLAKDIAPGYSRLAFEYAGLSFASPHSVRFKYKLEGFDNNWIDAGTRRVAYYTNIPPGSYRFRVLARTNDQAWNQSGATFSFRLRPHFYQTYWFDLLVALVLLFLAWQIYRWRVSQVTARYDAVLAERNRIAREIHDTLAQGFVALSLQLELISRALSNSKETAQELLRQAQSSVQTGLAEARRSIWELRSQNLENDDLSSKLSKVAAEVNSKTSIKAQFQVFGTRRQLPSRVEYELLKIGQEAVANVVRHAEAKHVNIDLSYEPKRLILAIKDDGRGFTDAWSDSGPNGHFGLKGMRERAEQIRAQLRVESTPGQGAQILVEANIE